jgi:hypothetical protein
MGLSVYLSSYKWAPLGGSCNVDALQSITNIVSSQSEYFEC